MKAVKPNTQKLPMQPVYLDTYGTPRFVPNRIVQYLLDQGPIDMNAIDVLGANGAFSKREQEQFAQLIGYSVSGFGDLSYARQKTIKKADLAAEKLL